MLAVVTSQGKSAVTKGFGMKKSRVTDHLDAATRERISKAGGKARAKKLSKRRRSEIASQAARARWDNA
jgi:hypothetical protein